MWAFNARNVSHFLIDKLRGAPPRPLRARDYVARHAPDLVVLDEFMPRLDGLDALRSLSRDERTKHVPVIMVASRAQAADKVRALERMDHYLLGPLLSAVIR